MRLIATAVAFALIALAGARASEFNYTSDDQESLTRCKPGWLYHDNRCYKLHPRIIEKKEDTNLCKFDYDGSEISTIGNVEDQKFAEHLLWERSETEQPVIIVPKFVKDKTSFGNWKSLEPKLPMADKCVAMEFRDNGTRGQWYLNDCYGQLLCSKIAKPSDKIAEIVPNVTTQNAPVHTDTDHNDTTATLPAIEVNTMGPSEPIQNESLPLVIENEPYDDLSINVDTKIEGEENSSLAGNSTLIVMFIIACLVIFFVLIFAYRLRKKAQVIALQSSNYDQNIYFDKRDLEQDAGGDMVLFEKETLRTKTK